MKLLNIGSALALTLMAGGAMAACAAVSGWTKLDATTLGDLGGKTVCVGAAPTWDAQEYHRTPAGDPGNLIDYKRGPTHAVDPSESVGSWSIVGNQIRHNYGPGADYLYDVYQNAGSYSFCVGSSEKAAATIRTGQVGC